MNLSRASILFVLTALAASGETQLRVTGMRQTSEQELLTAMGDRLAHVRASPPAAPLADDAAFILRQLLMKDGYANAEVTWRITGRDEITLIVTEGVRLSLGQVTVNGVSGDDAARFAKLFATPANKDRSLIGRRPPFIEGDVETGLAFVRQELNAHGHWAAQAAITGHNTDPATGSVNVTLDVRPGPVFRIGRPEITSDHEHGAALARSAAQPYLDREANTQNLNAMRAAVEKAVTASGYPDSSLLMTQSVQGNDFIPVFSVQLGERVRLNEIHVAGLDRTEPGQVTERLYGMEGEWYDEAVMNQRVRELLATGAFASARVETTPAGPQLIDATLHLEEAKAREVSVAVGAGSYQGVILRAGYADRNLFGRLLGFNAAFELSLLGLLGEIRLTDPWWFGSDIKASGRYYALLYNREGYNALETGLEGKLTRKFGKHYTLDLLAGHALVNLTEDGLPTSELGDTVYYHSRLRLNQSLDFRDSPVLPRSGWHLEQPLEIGIANGDLSTTYALAGLATGAYHQLDNKNLIGLGGEFNVLFPFDEGRDLPIDLRLFNGGARSVRSFPERELGPTVNGYPTGGEAKWSANLEWIHSLSDMVKAVAFMDAGALSRNHEDIWATQVELAAGLGIRFDLPIGPVRFEYGYNLTRDPGEPIGAFHFAIGFAY